MKTRPEDHLRDDPSGWSFYPTKIHAQALRTALEQSAVTGIVGAFYASARGRNRNTLSDAFFVISAERLIIFVSRDSELVNVGSISWNDVQRVERFRKGNLVLTFESESPLAGALWESLQPDSPYPDQWLVLDIRHSGIADEGNASSETFEALRAHVPDQRSWAGDHCNSPEVDEILAFQESQWPWRRHRDPCPSLAWEQLNGGNKPTAPFVAACRKAWHEECDGVTDELVSTYGVFWHKYLEARLQSSHPQVTASFGRGALGRHKGTLLAYGVSRAYERGILPLTLESLACPICGRGFNAATHFWWGLELMGGLRYCDLCFSAAFMPSRHEANPTMNYSAEDVRDKLQHFAREIGAIPTQAMVGGGNYRSLPALPTDLIRRDQVMIALMLLPPLERFHSFWGTTWVEILKQTEIIDGYWRPARGVWCQALDGTWMRSLSEKSVDDFLYTAGIAHEHEPVWPQDDEFNASGRRRADWLLEDGTYVEFAGLMSNKDYERKIKDKQGLAAKLGIPLLILSFSDLLQLPERFAPWLRSE